MPPRPNPFHSLNAGALSQIAKHLRVRDEMRLAASTRAYGNTLRNLTRRTRASVATIQGQRDKFARKVSSLITRMIAAHRKNPTAAMHTSSTSVQNENGMHDPSVYIVAEVYVDSNRRGTTLTISYFLPNTQYGVSSVAEATYYVRVRNGQYRLLARSKFVAHRYNNPPLPKITATYMRSLTRRAVEMYRAHPVTPWN